MSIKFSEKDKLLLQKLNRRSWTRSFSPVGDIDWDSETTDAEFRELHDAWSLLLGSKHEASMTEEQRIRFAQYQQINLMLGTAIFERFALANFESLYGDDSDPAYQEYVTHLIKEETYHYVLFSRAIARIHELNPSLRPMPERPFKIYFRVVLTLLRYMPFRRLRHGMFFYLLHFVEQITLYANTVTAKTVARDGSLVRKVWEMHAIDEARHVAFDDMMMRNAGSKGILGKLPKWLVLPFCVGASLLLNLNEIWAARNLGVRVSYLELPKLVRQTTAPFKRKVFRSIFDDKRQSESPA
ncbi:MAG: diiron oxygenase [Gammaproteobacteria bacterium]|nr:diiron oxygenase [Gammaproteobacteria bacterium]